MSLGSAVGRPALRRARNIALGCAEIDSGAHWLTSQAFSTTAARSPEHQSVYVGPSRPIRCSACKRCRRQRKRSRNSQEARLCPRPRYRVPSFCPVPGESRTCQLPTGKSRRIFASTEIVTGALRDGILPTSTHLRPDKLLRKDAFQKGFASHSRKLLSHRGQD